MRSSPPRRCGARSGRAASVLVGRPRSAVSSNEASACGVGCMSGGEGRPGRLPDPRSRDTQPSRSPAQLKLAHRRRRPEHRLLGARCEGLRAAWPEGSRLCRPASLLVLREREVAVGEVVAETPDEGLARYRPALQVLRKQPVGAADREYSSTTEAIPATGTARNTPTMPPRTPPAASATTITAGCAPSTSSASTRPPDTRCQFPTVLRVLGRDRLLASRTLRARRRYAYVALAVALPGLTKSRPCSVNSAAPL
jgi:hypothetical protein